MATQKFIPMSEKTAQAFEEINDFFEKEPIKAQLIFDAVIKNIKGIK